MFFLFLSFVTVCFSNKFLYFNLQTRWYTRRIGLATVYKSGELHLLQDKSLGFKDTWSFVNRALEECVKLDNMFESNAQLAKDVVNASVSTVSLKILTRV